MFQLNDPLAVDYVRHPAMAPTKPEMAYSIIRHENGTMELFVFIPRSWWNGTRKLSLGIFPDQLLAVRRMQTHILRTRRKTYPMEIVANYNAKGEPIYERTTMAHSQRE